MSLFESVLNTVGRILKHSLPENKFGDKAFSLLNFLIRHKRLPLDLPIFNNVLYKIKTSEEITDPLRVFVSDKEFVKLYVKAIVGDNFNIKTLKILRSIEAVDNYAFPSSCCIKPTHGSGKIILRRNDQPIDLDEIKSWFLTNYYKIGREKNYKTLKPKVIVEPLIFGESTEVLDYKIFCYNGLPKLIQIDVDRYTNHSRKFFDVNWNEQNFSICYEKSAKHLHKPQNLGLMLSIASQLSKGFSFVRIDLYSDGKNCFVGEITNCHGNAGEKFIPGSAEKFASQMIFN